MFFQQAEPSPDLAGIVKCYWEIAVPGRAAHATALIVPDGSPELVVELGSPTARFDDQGRVLSIERAVVAGQLTRAFELDTPPGYHAFGIRLHPWGAAALLGDEMPQITDQAAPMEALLGAPGRRLIEHVLNAGGFDARTGRAEAWLRARAAPRRITGWLPRASRALSAGQYTVAEVASQLQVSTRQLERVFIRGVGLSPKAFARQQRFAMAANALDQARTLADLAQQCGYADQAHMAREFRAFAGLAPSGLAVRLDGVSAALAGIQRGDVAFVQARGRAPF